MIYNPRATISDDGLYRYSLTREWDPSRAALVFVMLNPSTADADNDDPTIRRCIGFAKRQLFGALIVVNLYAYRATDPRILKTVADPTGPENDDIIRLHASGRTVIAAWGTRAEPDRVADVVPLLAQSRALFTLGTTKNGSPRHPLYVRGDAPLIEMETGL